MSETCPKVKPKEVSKASDVVVMTSGLLRSEKMDSLQILVMPVMRPLSMIEAWLLKVSSMSAFMKSTMSSQ